MDLQHRRRHPSSQRSRLAIQPLEARRMLASTQASPFRGDYDFSNTVDDADRAVWVSQFGGTGDGLAADGNADGVVDAADYTVWRDNLGATRLNLPPEAGDDSLFVNHAQTAALLASQLLANDCDPEGSPLLIVGFQNPSGGIVDLRDGVFFFTPDGSGTPLAFDYVVADAAGDESTATVQLLVRSPPHGMPGDGARAAEHMALFRLIDTAEATNVAVQSGVWSNPATWSAGVVPVAGERVLIHETVDVSYDLQSDTPLEWLRVDGVLGFRHDVPTRLVVETFVSDPRGTINLGTSEQAIDAGVRAEVLIDTSGGALSQIADPTLVGRGFVSHGQTNVFGAAKREFTTLVGDAGEGASFIELADAVVPEGWRVGDTLLLVGTEANPALLNTANQAAAIVAADAENSRFGDELLEITGLSVVDSQVRVAFLNVTNQSTIDAGLTTLLWNHERPDGETFDTDELAIHIANLTRNVVIRSSDPAVPNQERGHFMVMHNANAEIHHAQFKDLGRTDKRLVVDDPAVIGNFDGSPGTGTNPRGRYGLHLHRLGANDLAGAAAQVTGNVVWGSPGWGIVHHDSHAVLEDNVVFDVVGAGIVAEDGNELGLWRNNLVVKTTGDLVNDFDDGALFQTLRGPRFDLGFVGSGYWVQGGGFGIRLEDNIAASTNAAGFDLVHNTDLLANVELIPVELVADPVVRQSLLDAGFTVVTPNNVPTRGADGLVAYNGYRGIHTWLHNRDSGDMEGQFTFSTRLAHDFRSVIEDYTVWGVQTGVQNFYSTRFDFLNGLVVGDPQVPVPYFASTGQQANNSEGIGFSHNHAEANNLRFDGLRLEGFEYGFQVFSPLNEQLQRVSPYAVSELLNALLANVEHAFMPTNGSNPLSQAHRFSDLFVLDEVSAFNTNGSPTNVAPTAAFGFTAGEGLSVVLDATASFDPDPSPEVRPGDDGIVAYAWDLDGDGAYDDAYGRTLTLNFDTVGDNSVALKVWDDDGAISTASEVFSVVANGYANPWVDGDFSAAGPFAGEHYNIWSGRRGEGWIARDVIRNPAGFAEIGSPQFGLGGFAQLIRDLHVRRGEQTFSFDAINTNVAGPTNVLRVRLFGVNGQWELADGAPAPIHLMAIPQVTTLVDVNLGASNLSDWQTQSFDLDFGTAGYEYLVINVEYFGYDESLGDYFALDDFSLLSPTPGPALAQIAVGNDAGDVQVEQDLTTTVRDTRSFFRLASRDRLLLLTPQRWTDEDTAPEANRQPAGPGKASRAVEAVESPFEVAFARFPDW